MIVYKYSKFSCIKYLIRGEFSPLIKVYVFNTIYFSYFAGYSASNYLPFASVFSSIFAVVNS